MPASMPTQETRAVPAPALRVLLLDDDSFMLALLEDMLEDLGEDLGDDAGNKRGGIAVAGAASAQAALARLAEATPDLLICDLSMPDMDGIEFLRLLAQRGFGGAVLLLSGMDSGLLRAAERLAMAQGLTILGACSKPVAPAELGRMVALADAHRQSALAP